MNGKAVIGLVRRATWPATVIAIAAASFFITRAMLPSPQSVTAAGPPPPTGLEKEKVAIEADFAKPRFTGELNGFTLFGDDYNTWDLVRSWSPKCTGINGRYMSEAEAKTSLVDFEATYLPAGVQPAGASVAACEDEVVNIQRSYWDGKGT